MNDSQVVLTQKNIDGWTNLLTGMGLKQRDKTENTTYEHSFVIGQTELESLFRTDGVARRIVSLPAEDMTRNWITIDSDTDEEIIKWMDKNLNIRTKSCEQLIWSRLYGGAIGVMGLDDGRELDEELREENIRTFEFITIYDRYQVTWSDTDLYNDPKSEKHGQVQFYDVTPVNGQNFRVHKSRVLLLEGELLPDSVKQFNQGWHDSVLQGVYNSLKNLGTAQNGCVHIVEEFVSSVLTVDNLMNMLANGQENNILKRLDIMDLSRRINNTTILDKDEKFEKISSSVSGLENLLEKFIQQVSADTGIPASLLMGQSPKGLNASGSLEADIRYWNAVIHNKQEKTLRPYLQRVIDLTQKNKSGPTKGQYDENLTFEFKPLYEPTQEEIVNTRKTQAETDVMYIENGVLSPGDVNTSRFGGDKYSFETESSMVPQSESAENA